MQSVHSRKDCIGVKRKTRYSPLQFVGKHIEQDFRVGLGINMSSVTTVHIVLQFGRIGKISVVTKNNAKGGIDIKRLGFFGAHSASGCRVANMPNAHLAKKVTHVAGSKDIAHKSRSPRHKNAFSLGRCNARCILTPMLKQKQGVVEHLIHWTGRDNANDTTHKKTSKK